MKLAIIGAGESSRLKAEGLKTSKHLIKINGEHLIERIIRIGYETGAGEIICIINSQEPELKNYLLSSDFGIPLRLIVRDTESSMHSLFELSSFLMDEPFCLATTDTVFPESEFADFIRYSSSREGTDGILAVTGYIDDEKPLCVSMNGENRILGFSDSREGYNWATGGIYYFSPCIFNEMESAQKTGMVRLRNYLKLLVSRGYNLEGFPFSKIIDVDHLSDIPKAEALITDKKLT
jgi:NDP-sugar pyrophosphorylase family protein